MSKILAYIPLYPSYGLRDGSSLQLNAKITGNPEFFKYLTVDLNSQLVQALFSDSTINSLCITIMT